MGERFGAGGAPRERQLAIGLTAIAAAAVAGTITRPGVFRTLPFTAPDSLSYLEWSVSRTPAYPLFLSAVKLVSPDLGALGWIQLTLFLAAAWLLAWSFFRAFGSWLAALGVGAAVMLHPQLVAYAFTVLPESLFAAAIMVHLACAIRALCEGRGWFAGAGIARAIAILLKPSGYSLAACLPVLLIGSRDVRRTMLAGAAAASLVLAASIGNLATRGFFGTQAHGGYSLVASAAPFLSPSHGEAYSAVAAAIETDMAPVARELAAVRSIEAYYLASSYLYHFGEGVVWRRIREELARGGVRILDGRDGTLQPDVLQGVARIGGELGFRTVRAAPAIYARHVAAQVYGLWMLPLLQTAEGVKGLEAELERARVASGGPPTGPIAFRTLPLPALVMARTLLVAAVAASLIALVGFVVSRGNTLWAILAYASVAAHTNYLLVAAVQPGLPRYALMMWPVVMVCLAGTVTRLMPGRNPALRRG